MRRTNGITLIALVITIIVLLILAGVSIAMLTGNNGILTQAAKAQEETEKASVIEQAQTDIMGKQAEEGKANLDRTELKGILDMYFEGVPYDFSLETVLQTKETYGNYQILLSEIYGGTIEEKSLTATDMTEEQKKELYGSYVTNYECANNDAIKTEEGIPGKWMIFHIDDDNIYLIASDYINTVPNGKDGGKPDMGLNSSYPRGVSLLNIFDDYVNGSADISRIGQQLNKSYFKENNYTSTDYNMKSVAYMLDTNIWNTFKEEGVAEYAIGGPTIELFFESYNKVYPDANYPEGKFKARAKIVEDMKYQQTEEKLGEIMFGQAGGNYLEIDNSTYIINSFANASGMLLASPSAHITDNNTNTCYTCNVGYDGGLGFHDCKNIGSANSGLRPLVCLETDVCLRKTGNNTYEIIK